MTTAEHPPQRPRVTVGAVVALPFALGLVLTTRAFVLSKLWAWYAVPLGARQVGLATAAGFSLMILVVTRRDSAGSPDDVRRETAMTVMQSAVSTTILLLIAFGVGALVAAVR